MTEEIGLTTNQPELRRRAGNRWWKNENIQKSRFSSMKNKELNIGKSWEDKVRRRKEQQRIKEYERELKRTAEERKQQKIEKMKEKRKRKAENEAKSTIYQVIKNTDKIKKMSKKQLRSIKKSHIDKEGNLSYVPIYS
eukprot:snap_masked-scaffold_11-processed-gene-11.6-mRNA-1 protein AED:0.04 eAED:0.04 QI:0/-1/0/1/-1/1/1/0/137